MAEAARIEQMQVPNGGIADFVMSDEDIEAVYGPDEDGAEEYGTEGLGQFTEVANQMAEKGRYGDDTVAHLESGELVIPKAFLDQDPEMAKTLFAYLERMGVEDPQRYVVGSDANSINPETGLPEFFFKKFVRTVTKPIKKTVKKVVKTVSKVAKPIIKVIQKAAPIVLPIALSMTPLGPVFGSALGSGIASLINGGSIKDAFKKALISGAMGAAGAGFSNMLAGGGFMEGVSGAISDPIGRFGQTIAGAENSLTRLVGGTVAPEAPGFFSDYIAPAAAAAKPSTATTEALKGAGQPTSAEAARLEAVSTGNIPSAQDPYSYASAQFDAGAPGYTMSDSGEILYNNTVIPRGTTGGLEQAGGAAAPSGQISQFGDFQAGQLPGAEEGLTNFDLATTSAVQPYQRPSMIESLSEGNVSEAFFPSGPTPEQVQLAQDNAFNKAYDAALARTGDKSIAYAAGQTAMRDITASSMGPSLYNQAARIAAPVAAGLALTEATGITDFTKQFLTPPPQEEVGLVERDEQGNVITGQDLIEQDPERYLVSDLGQQVYNPATGEYELVQNLDPRSTSYTNFLSPSSFKYDLFSPQSTPGGPFQRPVAAADGGPIFPRRNGGIMPNEGVPGKDSVRAMLMPGEFVMTTDAVRGAGNGNLNRGIKNMYSVMRDLESRGRRMA